MAQEIEYWSVESDNIEEVTRPSCETRIFAVVKERPGETPEQTVSRAKLACYDYRDPDGYSCQRDLPHPLNTARLRRECRPMFLSHFTITEDEENIRVCRVVLHWRVPEEMEGAVDLRKSPPERGSWSQNTPIFRDPNSGEWYLTSAGELIQGISFEAYWTTLTYRIRTPTLPQWYRLYFGNGKGGVINSDVVVLDGQAYQPRTLWIPEVPASPIEIGLGYWRELTVTVRVREDTWDEIYPNAGLYERHYLIVKRDRTGKPTTTFYPALQFMTEAEIVTQAQRLAGRSTVTLSNPNFPGGASASYFFVGSYRRVQDQLLPTTEDETIHEPTNMTEPVALSPEGFAYRSDMAPHSIREILPRELVVRKLSKYPAVKFSQFGLW